MPLVIAAAAVLLVAAVVVVVHGTRQRAPTVAPVQPPSDPYASNLSISGLQMSESANLAGGKVTYLDGQIANKGDRTVTGISVQVLFRNAAQEVAQNETQPLKIIRTRDPYIDVEPVSAAPLKPGDQRDFRLIFDRRHPRLGRCLSAVHSPDPSSPETQWSGRNYSLSYRVETTVCGKKYVGIVASRLHFSQIVFPIPNTNLL